MTLSIDHPSTMAGPRTVRRIPHSPLTQKIAKLTAKKLFDYSARPTVSHDGPVTQPLTAGHTSEPADCFDTCQLPHMAGHLLMKGHSLGQATIPCLPYLNKP